MKKFWTFVLLFGLLTGCVFTQVPQGCNTLQPRDQGVVSIRTPWGAGSGFVIGEDAKYYYVGTAAHVVSNDAGESTSIAAVNGVWGDVVGFGNPDAVNDVAIIRVEKHNRRYRIYQIATIRREAKVRAVGFVYANGMDDPLYVIYHGRVVTLNWDGFIVCNSGIFPGMSGGPLFDEWGRVVGVCSRCPSAWGCPMDSSGMWAPATPLIEMLREVRNAS